MKTDHEFVKLLVGPIMPVGETETDDDRFSNLGDLTELVDRLVGDLAEVARMHYREEASVAYAGRFAANFLRELKEALEEDITHPHQHETD